MAPPIHDISQALMIWLPSIMTAYNQDNVAQFTRCCDRLAEELVNAIRRDTIDTINEMVHIHDWEYDDQGGYECGCGEKRRD